MNLRKIVIMDILMINSSILMYLMDVHIIDMSPIFCHILVFSDLSLVERI